MDMFGRLPFSGSIIPWKDSSVSFEWGGGGCVSPRLICCPCWQSTTNRQSPTS